MNNNEAARDTFRALQQRRRDDARRHKALRTQIKAGVEALERGEFTEIADVDLDRYLATLTVSRRKRTR